MTEEIGISSAVDQLHQRLDEARESARDDLSTVEELLSGGEQGEQDRETASVSEAETEQEKKPDGRRTLVTPPPKEDAGDGEEESEPAAEEERASRECRECGKRYHADFPDEDYPKLCEECIVSKTEAPGPTTVWREEFLSKLDEAILDVLHEAYPQELSASEIADRLPARNIEPSDANRSSVNSELYGALRDWLKKKGRRPPVWSLAPADESAQSTASGEAEKKPSQLDDGDRAPFERSTASSLDQEPEPGATEHQPHAPAEASTQEADLPEECPICSEPMEESHEWRNERMCSACYEALKDI